VFDPIPSTMMKFRKQKRFRIVPATVMDGLNRHGSVLDLKAEAAHTLWAGAYTRPLSGSAQAPFVGYGVFRGAFR